jgi:hypothetical protein
MAGFAPQRVAVDPDVRRQPDVQEKAEDGGTISVSHEMSGLAARGEVAAAFDR